MEKSCWWWSLTLERHPLLEAPNCGHMCNIARPLPDKALSLDHALLYAVMAQYQSLHAVPLFQYGHCTMDEVQVLGIAFNGVQVTSMFELLAELQKPVKEEIVEDQISLGPRGFDKEQKAFLESLSKKGLRDFDPSYQKRAFSKWQHLLRSVDLRELRHTHAQVSAKFRHGEHQGQRISDLTRQLKEGQVKSEDITPLVCLFWNDVHWVICGNRRLKALRDFASSKETGQVVLVNCIVHPDPKKAPPALIARFLLAWSTTNHGCEVTVGGRQTAVAVADHSKTPHPAEQLLQQLEPPDLEDRPRFTGIPHESDDFYVRYYVGHKGRYGHEFLEFEVRPDGRLRYANNSLYHNDIMIRKECNVAPAVIAVLRNLVSVSGILKEDDDRWPAPDRNGRQELEIVVDNEHICFNLSKIGLLADVQASKDPEGLRVFYHFVQDLKCLVFSLISLHFRVKPLWINGQPACMFRQQGLVTHSLEY